MSRQSPSSRPSASQGQLPAAGPLQPRRPCATRHQPRLPVVTVSPSNALKALEAGEARNPPPGSAARRRCFAERDASKLENGEMALGSTTCPSSPRRCFAERDARPLGRREALDRLLERVCDRLKGEIVRADVSTSSHSSNFLSPFPLL
ncbi:hypothetical protein B0H19DRAFT_1262524 [Mycena capillaripes]|nr:hypothetical protein B0H19DRAFT_1262524 [Mycena capillaripes]